MVDNPLFMRDVAEDGFNEYITNSDWFRFDQSDITRFRVEMQNIIGTLTEYYHNHRVEEPGRRILYEIRHDSDEDDEVVEVSTVSKDRSKTTDEESDVIWEENSIDCSDESLASNYLPNSDVSEYDSDNDFVADTSGNCSY